jgi:hypothetical protein
MALNFTTTYTMKSNAQAALRKAVKKGERAVGDYTVVSLSGGFRIVAVEPAPFAEEATSPAGWRAPEPQPSVEDEAAYRAQQQAEFDAANLEAMLEPLPSERAPEQVEAMPADLVEEAMKRGLSPDQFAEIANRVAEERVGPFGAEDREKIWTILQGFETAERRDVTPGLARLRAHPDAEAIRAAELADQDKAAVRAVEATAPRRGRKAKAENEAWRQGLIRDLDADKGKRASKPAAKPAGGVSAEAAMVLKALFFSPALPIVPDDKVGVWVDYKTINESDAPHGLAARRVPGYVAGLQRRGLVECRMDKPGRFSARLTAAGVALAQEAGR